MFIFSWLMAVDGKEWVWVMGEHSEVFQIKMSRHLHTNFKGSEH